MNPIIKKSSEIANEMLDSVSWLIKRMESPGKDVNLNDALGKTAEVATTIEPGRAGEILLPMGGSVGHYSARSAKANVRIAKGTKVRIVDVLQNTMSVETVDAVSQSPSVSQTVAEAPKSVSVSQPDETHIEGTISAKGVPQKRRRS